MIYLDEAVQQQQQQQTLAVVASNDPDVHNRHNDQGFLDGVVGCVPEISGGRMVRSDNQVVYEERRRNAKLRRLRAVVEWLESIAAERIVYHEEEVIWLSTLQVNGMPK